MHLSWRWEYHQSFLYYLLQWGQSYLVWILLCCPIIDDLSVFLLAKETGKRAYLPYKFADAEKINSLFGALKIKCLHPKRSPLLLGSSEQENFVLSISWSQDISEHQDHPENHTSGCWHPREQAPGGEELHPDPRTTSNTHSGFGMFVEWNCWRSHTESRQKFYRNDTVVINIANTF